MIITVLLELKVNESTKKKHTHTHTHYPLVDMLLNDVTISLA